MTTFKEQFDKITVAYIKGEIKPYRNSFCFCGTLDPTASKSWSTLKAMVLCRMSRPHWSHGTSDEDLLIHVYTGREYIQMESALLFPFAPLVLNARLISGYNCTLQEILEKMPEYEDTLFEGMCAAIEVMREIHIKRGEIIDEAPAFKRRDLSPVNV